MVVVEIGLVLRIRRILRQRVVVLGRGLVGRVVVGITMLLRGDGVVVSSIIPILILSGRVTGFVRVVVPVGVVDILDRVLRVVTRIPLASRA